MNNVGDKKLGTIIAVAIVVVLIILAFVFGVFDGKSPEVTNEPQLTENRVGDLLEGLTGTIISPGNGEIAEEGKLVAVHMVGRLADGTVFVDTYDGGDPIEFLLGAGQVMEGLDVGIVGMREGEVRELRLAPELISGDTQFDIPAGASAVFEIELVEVSEPEGGKG
ncbi:MAG: FKBP-type peptidyl-prolyl cis-trans isomerase [Candidatus Paceibacterota bacterium]